MKVLFVGDGSHDVGTPEFSPQPRTASGVVATLCRKIVPSISMDSQSLAWREIPLFGLVKKRGLEHRLVAAKEIATRHGCQATIAVADADGDAQRRLASLKSGQQSIQKSDPSHPVAVGVAVESIEAWTLGDSRAIATILELEHSEVERQYRPSRVEELNNNSEKPEKQSKVILKRLAEMKHRAASTDFRVEVAERSDPATLRQNCPLGFAPFADELKMRFE